MTALETYLRTATIFTDDEIAMLSSAATRRTIQRNEHLLQLGQVCRHKTFVEKGLLRIYGTAADGTEAILNFSPEHSWALDPESYHQLTGSNYNITAIERTEVLQWTKPVFDQLSYDIPALRNYSQQLMSRYNINSRQRLFTTLSATPEERYEDFLRTYPDFLSRLPLHMIASYLGISLKTLTRIRHAQLHR
jgi:CRP-like cAMP-binding protein